MKLERIIAAQGHQILFEMSFYQSVALLETVQLSETEEAKELLEKSKEPLSSHYGQLEKDEARMLLRAIWMSSGYFSDADRRRLNKHEKYLLQKGRAITRRSLGVLLHRYRNRPAKVCKRVDHFAKERELEACIRAAQRISDAAIILGLLETDPKGHKNPKYRPLRATVALDRFIRGSAVKSAKLLYRLIEQLEQRCPDGEDG